MIKRKTDNYLQQLDKSANIKFGMLYSVIMEDLQGIGFSTDPKKAQNMVRGAFRGANYREKVEDTTIEASVKAAEYPMKDFASVKVDEYIGWIKTKPYEGTALTLSAVIRDNATQASRDIQRLVAQEIKKGTNWRTLSRQINKIDKVEDVAKIIKEVAADGLRALPTREAKAAFRKKVRQANTYISRLSPGTSPTKQLKKAYAGVLDALLTKDKDIIKASLEKAFKQKINYNNDRIARTELARAYELSFKARIMEDENITGFQWVLSNAHPRPDICDFYAELDNGKGVGVYSKNDFPTLPAHSNCLCFKVPYVGDKPHKATKKDAERYLHGLSDKKRGQVIGVGNSKYRSRYLDGLESKGVDFEGKGNSLPKYLYKKEK